MIASTLSQKRRIGARRNLLHRYQAIIDEFNKYDARIIPISTIWREYIYPKFHISRETLYRILSTPIEEELEKVESRQLSLF